MTLDFYDLKEEPFGFLPDSRFLFLTATHRETLGSLLLALQAGRGFVTLMAQPGLGKTTLLFHTLHSFGDRVVTVYLFQAPRTPVDLLRAVLTDLGVHTIDSDEEGMFSQLREVLLETHRRGKRVFIVIDEAQKIDGTVFYLLCTLANQVTLGAKVIQFILCGQPALAGRLAEIGPVPSMECGAAGIAGTTLRPGHCALCGPPAAYRRIPARVPLVHLGSGGPGRPLQQGHSAEHQSSLL